MKFSKFLDTVSFKHEEDRDVLLRLRAEIESGNLGSCNKILIKGNNGVGKTFLANNLLSKSRLPILYYGLEPEKDYIACKSMAELLAKAEESSKCIVLIDHLWVILKSKNYPGMDEPEDIMRIIRILDIIDRSKNKMIIMINYFDSPDSSIDDKLNVIIGVSWPNAQQKEWFMSERYGHQISKEFASFIAKKTYGYSYRDIESIAELIISPNKKITIEQIKGTIRRYTPSSLSHYEIIHDTGLDFSKLVGKEEIKERLNNVIMSLQNKELANELGIKVKNLLFFYGNPGSGKTYMAKALAGEMDMPIICIKGNNINTKCGTPSEMLQEVIRVGKRFGDCILLFDEADKVFGKNILGEDHELQGDLQSYLDGTMDGLQAPIIFTLNEEARFGAPLKDRFLMFRFDDPTDSEKTEFLRNKAKLASRHFTFEFEIDQLVSELDSKSFREIEKVWDNTLLSKLIHKEKSASINDFKDTEKLMKVKKGNQLCG